MVLAEGKADQEMGVFGPPPKIPQTAIVPRDEILVTDKRTGGIEAKLEGPHTETGTWDYGGHGGHDSQKTTPHRHRMEAVGAELQRRRDNF